jgi:Holliday junction resolvase
MNSRDKGARGERELAELLRQHGFDARRGQQFSGANGDADVEGMPGIHIECKRVEKQDVNSWLEQSERDAYADSLKRGYNVIPVVFHRQNFNPRKPVKGKWKVTLYAEDFIELVKRGLKNGKKNHDI